MTEQRQVVHGDHERHSRTPRRAERRAVEEVEPARTRGRARTGTTTRRVRGGGAAGAAEGEALELEPGAALERADEPSDVAGRAGGRLRERGDVDADPHARALDRHVRGAHGLTRLRLAQQRNRVVDVAPAIARRARRRAPAPSRPARRHGTGRPRSAPSLAGTAPGARRAPRARSYDSSSPRSSTAASRPVSSRSSRAAAAAASSPHSTPPATRCQYPCWSGERSSTRYSGPAGARPVHDDRDLERPAVTRSSRPLLQRSEHHARRSPPR